MAKRTKKTDVVAEIGIYGTAKVGFGYICRRGDGTMTDSCSEADRPETMLRADRSATDALFLAVRDLRLAGIVRGTVVVHRDYDFGPRMARFSLSDPTPYLGQLKWEQAPVIKISAEQIARSAAK